MGRGLHARSITRWGPTVTVADKTGRTEKRALHVLTLTPFYPNESDDGAGCFVAEPLRALSDSKVISTVFALQPFYRKQLRAAESGHAAEWLRYVSLPTNFGLPSAGFFAFARILGRIRDLNSRQPIDLIHAHAPLPAGHVAMLLNAELGFPYVVSVHGLDVFSTGQINGRVGRWCRRISRLVYQRSKRVLCVSEAVRERVLEGMPAACRTSVVYNGVDAELFSPGSVAASQKTTVLSVGNLLPSKGHEVLIRAIGDIAPEFPNLALEIIGEGPELAHLQQVIQDLNLTQQVTLLGRRSRREVADAMRRCVLFALPSSYEGLGCVYLEAMSTAKPAVGCRGQGIAEIIRHGENGFLVGAGNVKELSLLLAMMLRDPQGRNNVGAAARDTILDRFILAQQAEHLARIYRECAG